jgi:hypothetical protein
MPVHHRTRPKRDWRPPVGSFLRANGDDEVGEVVAHFDGDGYGACLVLKIEVAGRPTTRILTRSEWLRRGYVVVP